MSRAVGVELLLPAGSRFAARETYSAEASTEIGKNRFLRRKSEKRSLEQSLAGVACFPEYRIFGSISTLCKEAINRRFGRLITVRLRRFRVRYLQLTAKNREAIPEPARVRSILERRRP
jgi:hypothetical protein